MGGDGKVNLIALIRRARRLAQWGMWQVVPTAGEKTKVPSCAGRAFI